MTCSANIRHKSERNHLSLFWTQFQFTNGPGCHPSTAYARWVRPPGWFFLPPARARREGEVRSLPLLGRARSPSSPGSRRVSTRDSRVYTLGVGITVVDFSE